MPRKYDIILTAQIEIGGVYEANTAAEAVEQARRELRVSGQLSDVATVRAVFLDDPEPAV